MLILDGSHGEGGGQVLRTALSLRQSPGAAFASRISMRLVNHLYSRPPAAARQMPERLAS